MVARCMSFNRPAWREVVARCLSFNRPARAWGGSEVLVFQ